jgi:5-methylcytosine-specific restriction protein A
MARGLRVCSTPGCPNLTPGGKCDGCQAKAEQQRGTSTQRGYGHKHRTLFRPRVLARANYICELCQRNVATVADHHPLSRRELVDAGMNPNDPRHGRALCKPCHDRETAVNQPGGWNQR